MKNYLKVLLTAITLILCVAILVGCSNKEENKSNTPGAPQTEIRQLSAPADLAIDNQFVSWSAVVNANGYAVKINTTDYDIVFDTTLNLNSLSLANGTYQVSVKAIGQTVGNTRYTDSDYCAVLDFTKSSIPNGTYRMTFAIYDNKTYDVSKADEMRNFYKTYSINSTILSMQTIYPDRNFNDLTYLKTFYDGLFDFTGINTVEQFWDAYIESFIDERDVNLFATLLAVSYIKIENNLLYAYHGMASPSLSTAFTSYNGVIILENPSAVSMINSALIYIDDTIIETPITYRDSGFNPIFIYKLSVTD